MAKTRVRPASKRPIRRSADDSLSGDFARFLHGEDGRAAEVEVEVVVFAPVCEELWFRGIGLTGLMKTGSATRAVVWTSLVFGALHGPDRFLFTTLFGIVLALIRFRTGSLYCCIAIHALHNFLAIVLSFVLALWAVGR
jgi:hypothetical protein